MGHFTLFSCWFYCYVFTFILLKFCIIRFNNCCLVFCLLCDFNFWFIFLSFADFNGCRSVIFWLSKWVHLAFVWKKLLTFMLIWLISGYIGNVVSHWFVCMATNGVCGTCLEVIIQTGYNFKFFNGYNLWSLKKLQAIF